MTSIPFLLLTTGWLPADRDDRVLGVGDGAVEGLVRVVAGMAHERETQSGDAT
jgi:hypothetical protein